MHTQFSQSKDATRRLAFPLDPSPDELLAEVDFKWLMAGQGCWIDSTRLRTDAVYALDCLQMAIHSPCDPLRACARAMQEGLELPT